MISVVVSHVSAALVPILQAAYTSLADQGLDPACTQATQAVALSILPALLSLYQQPGTPATSLFSTQQLQLTRTAASAVTSRLTHQKFGLLAVEPACLSPGSQGPEHADVSLNAWATWLAQQARSGSSNGSNAVAGGELSGAWASISDASTTWTKAAESQLVADAVAARQGSRSTKPGPYTDLEALAWARLVLGAGWSPTVSKPAAANSGKQDAAAAAAPKDVSAEVKKDLSMQRLTAAALAGNLTVGGQARVGLTLLKAPAGTTVTDAAGKALSAAKAAQRISKRLVSSTRVGGRTAYVATGEGGRAAAGGFDNGLQARQGRYACMLHSGQPCAGPCRALLGLCWAIGLGHHHTSTDGITDCTAAASLLLPLQACQTSPWLWPSCWPPRRHPQTTPWSRSWQPGLRRVRRLRRCSTPQPPSAAAPGTLPCAPRRSPRMTAAPPAWHLTSS